MQYSLVVNALGRVRRLPSSRNGAGWLAIADISEFPYIRAENTQAD